MIALMQVTMPTDGTNPYAWFLVIALGAIGFMFKILNDGQNKRTERCEKREDLMLEDNRSQAATIKEQSTTLLRVAGIAEQTFAMAKSTSEKIDTIQRLIEDQHDTARRRQ
jgi:hypothetical protein